MNTILKNRYKLSIGCINNDILFRIEGEPRLNFTNKRYYDLKRAHNVKTYNKKYKLLQSISTMSVMLTFILYYSTSSNNAII